MIARVLLTATLLTLTPWAMADQSAAELRTALAASSRPTEDKARDESRKPAEVIAFLGFDKGDTVMDIMAAGGFNTEVLSVAVGPKGKVYAQNLPMMLKMREGAVEKALSERLANNRLPNVQRLDKDFADIDLPAGSLDGAITSLNFHDLYNRGPDGAVAMLKVMYNLLKPGAVLGVIDHVGTAGADNTALHRVQKQAAIDSARAAGFEIAGDSDLLANASDDHTKQVFAQEQRGHTDRFLLKLKKPG